MTRPIFKRFSVMVLSSPRWLAVALPGPVAALGDAHGDGRGAGGIVKSAAGVEGDGVHLHGEILGRRRR